METRGGRNEELQGIAVRWMKDHKAEYPSADEALKEIASKIRCPEVTVRRWVYVADRKEMLEKMVREGSGGLTGTSGSLGARLNWIRGTR